MNARSVTKREAAIATVCYADVFDFPLRIGEFRLWALFKMKGECRIRALHQSRGFIVLRGREHLVAKRQKRENYQEKKWHIARRISRILGYIPTLRLIGVTGGLAMNNAKPEDDVDLYIVAANGTVWITRLITILVADMLGMRRKPEKRNVSDKVCLNMFVSARGMIVPPGERDCYSAHEVLQMVPLFEEKGTYRAFIRNNRWVRRYLPRAWSIRLQEELSVLSRTPVPVLWIFQIAEFWAKILQIWFMKRPKTHEIVTDNRLRFHPNDARVWIKQQLAIRLKKFNIPLDIIFYSR